MASGSRVALDATWPQHANTAMTDRATRTHVEVEVRRIYEPSRLGGMYMSAAYAKVVPVRKRPARWTASTALSSVDGVVAVRPELGDVEARRAG
jgi:hypothetical protein